MEKEAFELSATLPVLPERVYRAWLSSEEHGAFTGGPAEIVPQPGSNYSIYNGYINGRLLELEPGKRILQTWRADEFTEQDEDSMLEVSFLPAPEGSRLHIRHWNIPARLKDEYYSGWQEYYFKPMQEYFANEAAV